MFDERSICNDVSHFCCCLLHSGHCRYVVAIMTKERDALEDAYDRAEVQQEIAFRNYQRAKNRNVGPLMRASLEHAKRAYSDLCRLSAKLSKRRER